MHQVAGKWENITGTASWKRERTLASIFGMYMIATPGKTEPLGTLFGSERFEKCVQDNCQNSSPWLGGSPLPTI